MASLYIKKGEEKFYYDKILADVPCTGDGAIRKIP
jgi:16S rRNA C967 or C1407 C5-methylase (RsmB/RsmF family)